jgi:hypothetical protein
MNDHYIRVEGSPYIWVRGSKIGSGEFKNPETECEEFVQRCEDYEKRYPGLNRAEDYNNWGCCLCSQGGCPEGVQILKKGLAAADAGHMHKPDREEDTRLALRHNREECEILPLLVEAEPEEIEETGPPLDGDEDLAIG